MTIAARARLEPIGRKVRLSVPSVSTRVSPDCLASVLVRLIASGAAVTRSELIERTGLARSSITEALLMLELAGVVKNHGVRPVAGRGRPAELLGLNPAFGVVLVADLGASRARISVHDAGQSVLGHEEFVASVSRGPEKTIDELAVRFRTVLANLGVAPRERLVMVIGMPGPVDPGQGVTVKPPIMPGWDDFPVAAALEAELGCDVLCENDVNLRALGEARALPESQSPLLYIKVGTGIGGGLVTTNGELYRGADGAAGDIGHVRVTAPQHAECPCGNVGCLEAVAAVPSILRSVQRIAGPNDEVPASIEELFQAIRANNRLVVGQVREAAALIGEVVADLVQAYNPARVVMGGSLTGVSDDLLTEARAVVYRRALPLATRRLVITRPLLGTWSGTAGGLVVGQEHALTAARIAPVLERVQSGLRRRH
ncbi:ROK family protein [Sinomonas sp. G460-2]|uniref:ROK family protein n=1 Tax=Sinomonas sp. G460-2 TaxID=3393464 RepID=UPI0039F057BC